MSTVLSRYRICKNLRFGSSSNTLYSLSVLRQKKHRYNWPLHNRSAPCLGKFSLSTLVYHCKELKKALEGALKFFPGIKIKPEQKLCFQNLVVKRKDVLGVWKRLTYSGGGGGGGGGGGTPANLG